MNLEPTASQVEIATGVAEFLRCEFPAKRLLHNDAWQRGRAQAELKSLAGQGWIGATLSAEVGGAEMTLPTSS